MEHKMTLGMYKFYLLVLTYTGIGNCDPKFMFNSGSLGRLRPSIFGNQWEVKRHVGIFRNQGVLHNVYAAARTLIRRAPERAGAQLEETHPM